MNIKELQALEHTTRERLRAYQGQRIIELAAACGVSPSQIRNIASGATVDLKIGLLGRLVEAMLEVKP